jgi:UTP--glucose-1-phosphate uridylyltransferase
MSKKNVTVRKAVIAAAGFGTRFLPQTKALPKEMLPLVDKPIIQHIVEELAEAGVEDIVIVTGYHKRSIEDHFDKISGDLRANLELGNKKELLKQTSKISELANFAYIRQKGPLGNGTPVLNAAHLIGDEPFIYTYADDFIEATPCRFSQLIDVHATYGGSVLTCVERDNDEDYTRYGYVGGKEDSPGLIQMSTIVEKPGSRSNSPSKLASVSSYLLEPAIFSYLEKLLRIYDNQEEFKIQEALQNMMNDGHKFYGARIKNGTYYDTGNKLEYLKTVIDFSLKHEELKDDLFKYLHDKIKAE